MNGADSIQIISVDVFRISAAHNINQDIRGNVPKVGKDKRRPIAVLIAIGEVVERNKAEGRFSLAVGRQRIVDNLAGEVQVDLVLASTQNEHVTRIRTHY